jgi:hypothetical protein
MEELMIKIKPGFGESKKTLLQSFISVSNALPANNIEVDVIQDNDFKSIGRCMYYADLKIFGTYYKMLITGVTHWRFAKK